MRPYLFTLVAIFAMFFIRANVAFALNQTGAWSFTNNTNWTWTNATWTNTCTVTTSTTGTGFGSFARDSTGVVSSKSVENTRSNTTVGGNINQTFIATSTGATNFKGRFSFSSTGNSWNASNSWIRLDIYDSSNSTWVGTLGCATFNANTATTTVTTSQPVVLTGGTTYTIRGSTQVVGSTANPTLDNVWMDTIVVSAPPVNGAISAPTNTKNALLTWDVSTATTSANGLAAANGYGIYRGTSSGAETALASSTSASYTDSATVGNTTYYYWLTNTDTASYESASSTQLSLLTQPDAPTITSFTNLTQTSLTVNWSAPTGGAATYKVYRCANVGYVTCSPTVFLANAGAGTSYNDSGLIAGTTYVYQVVGTNATGDGVFSAAVSTTATPTTTRKFQLFKGYRIKFIKGRMQLLKN